MRVVITGPTGAIGVALVQEYIGKQTEVLAICHKGSPRNRNLPESPYLTVTESDLNSLFYAADAVGGKYDVFFHLAWAGTASDARNDMYLQNRNIEYTLDAVRLAHRMGCHTFIGAGSQAEYGRVEGFLTGKTPVFPENGYGMAKLCAGQMTRALCEKLHMRHIWVRILSVYGPCDGEHSMVSEALQKLLRGEHVGFTLAEQKWDYLYSSDAARALALLADQGRAGKTYVLGSGRVCPLKDYIQTLYRIVCEYTANAGSLGIGDLPYSEKQVMFLGADIRELTADTGFVPEICFEEGIRRTIISQLMSQKV